MGGSQRFINLLANHLDKNRFEVHLVLIDGRSPYFTIDSEVIVHNLATKRIKNSLLKIRKKVQLIRPNIVFSTNGRLNLPLAILRFLFPRSTKFVARESTVLTAELSYYGTVARWLVKKAYQWFYPNFSCIVCQSIAMKAELAKYNIQHPHVKVINNPVNFQEIEKNTTIACDEKYDLIAVGRLSKIKGYSRLLDIVQQYKQRYSKNITAAIIGNGTEKVSLTQKIHQLELSQNVFLLGGQKNPFKYLKNAKAFLLTSHFEGFPNVLLEAGCCGIPTIAYDVLGGTSEIIEEGKNGFLVPNGDQQKMVQQIEKLFTYPFDQEAIVKSTIQRFGITPILRKYERLFDEVLSNAN